MMPRALFALFVAVIVTAGCGDDADVDAGAGLDDPGGEFVDDRPGGEWILVSGSGPVGGVPIVAGHDVTLEFRDGEIAGRAACNSYVGTVRNLGGGEWAVDGYAATEMACPEPGVQESERAYLGALGAVDSYILGDDATLVLRGPDTELRFEFVPPTLEAPLVGTTWVLGGLVEGDAVSNIAGMEAATLTFADDGTFTASLSCNFTGGEWTLDGDSLSMSAGDITDQGCSESEQVVEDHILGVLSFTELSLEITENRLTIVDADGRGMMYRSGGD